MPTGTPQGLHISFFPFLPKQSLSSQQDIFFFILEASTAILSFSHGKLIFFRFLYLFSFHFFSLLASFFSQLLCTKDTTSNPNFQHI
ncbi:Uncharacterized protein TCM_018143 [Theobroma cacao]|uniref:Uncharacterized protein n=1 Tax=Theobroma cacao TaxID=3641 RepID=A0A061EE85_THECC|nr:Uncharacterized protein TCM_018143 [Theobroma cacao]